MLTLVDLNLFYGKVKFGPLCFCVGGGGGGETVKVCFLRLSLPGHYRVTGEALLIAETT